MSSLIEHIELSVYAWKFSMKSPTDEPVKYLYLGKKELHQLKLEIGIRSPEDYDNPKQLSKEIFGLVLIEVEELSHFNLTR